MLISPPTRTPPFLFVALPKIKVGHINSAGISSSVPFNLVGLERHLGLEDCKLLLHAFPLITHIVCFFKVLLQGLVVYIVSGVSRIPLVADVASLVLFAAVLVKLVIVVESGPTELTERVPLESCQSTWLVGIAEFDVLPQLLVRVHVMFVGEEFLVPGAEVAHLFVVYRSDMLMQIRPAKPGKVAGGVGAVVS